MLGNCNRVIVVRVWNSGQGPLFELPFLRSLAIPRAWGKLARGERSIDWRLPWWADQRKQPVCVRGRAAMYSVPQQPPLSQRDQHWLAGRPQLDWASTSPVVEATSRVEIYAKQRVSELQTAVTYHCNILWNLEIVITKDLLLKSLCGSEISCAALYQCCKIPMWLKLKSRGSEIR